MASPQPVGGHAMYNVTIITDEKRFEILKDAMEAIGITGMTITRALGFGIEKGRTEFYRGAKVSAKLLPKVRVEMVVPKYRRGPSSRRPRKCSIRATTVMARSSCRPSTMPSRSAPAKKATTPAGLPGSREEVSFYGYFP